MKFNDRLQKRFQESINNNEICFFCGDYNVCPVLEMDVYSVEKDGSITNTWQEREKFKKICEEEQIELPVVTLDEIKQEDY